MLQQNIRNQENVRVGVKSMVLGTALPTTKRSALGEIGNDPAACGVVAARKVGVNDIKVHALPRK
jgi:hypothetical protein